MQISIQRINAKDCQCTVVDECHEPAVAVVVINHPDGQLQTLRYFCLEHLTLLQVQIEYITDAFGNEMLKQLLKEAKK